MLRWTEEGGGGGWVVSRVVRIGRKGELLHIVEDRKLAVDHDVELADQMVKEDYFLPSCYIPLALLARFSTPPVRLRLGERVMIVEGPLTVRMVWLG